MPLYDVARSDDILALSLHYIKMIKKRTTCHMECVHGIMYTCNFKKDAYDRIFDYFWSLQTNWVAIYLLCFFYMYLLVNNV